MIGFRYFVHGDTTSNVVFRVFQMKIHNQIEQLKEKIYELKRSTEVFSFELILEATNVVIQIIRISWC